MKQDKRTGHVNQIDNSKITDMKSINKRNIAVIIQTLQTMLEEVSEDTVSIGSIQIAPELAGNYYSKMAQILQQRNKNQNEEKQISKIKKGEDQDIKQVNQQSRRIIQNGSEKKKDKKHISKDKLYKNSNLLEDIILQQKYIQYQHQLIAQQNMKQSSLGLMSQHQLNSQQELRQNYSDESLDKKSENNKLSFQSEGTKVNQNKIIYQENTKVDTEQSNQSYSQPLEHEKQYFEGNKEKQNYQEQEVEVEEEEEKEEQKHDYNTYQNQNQQYDNYLNKRTLKNHFQVSEQYNQSSYFQQSEGFYQPDSSGIQENQQQQIARQHQNNYLNYKSQDDYNNNQIYQHNNININNIHTSIHNQDLVNCSQDIKHFKDGQQNSIQSYLNISQVGDRNNINNNQTHQEQLSNNEIINKNQQQNSQSITQSNGVEMTQLQIKQQISFEFLPENIEKKANSDFDQPEQQESYCNNNQKQEQINYDLYPGQQKYDINSNFVCEQQSNDINKASFTQIEKQNFSSAQSNVNTANMSNDQTNEYFSQNEQNIQNQNYQQNNIQSNILKQQNLSLEPVYSKHGSEQNIHSSQDKSQIDGDQNIQQKQLEEKQEQIASKSNEQLVVNEHKLNFEDTYPLAYQNIEEQQSSLIDLSSQIHSQMDIQNNPFGLSNKNKDYSYQNQNSERLQQFSNEQQAINNINILSEIDQKTKKQLEEKQEQNTSKSNGQLVVNEYNSNQQDKNPQPYSNIEEQQSSLIDLSSQIYSKIDTQNHPFGITQNIKDSFCQNENSERSQQFSNVFGASNNINLQSEKNQKTRRNQPILNQNILNQTIQDHEINQNSYSEPQIYENDNNIAISSQKYNSNSFNFDQSSSNPIVQGYDKQEQSQIKQPSCFLNSAFEGIEIQKNIFVNSSVNNILNNQSETKIFNKEILAESELKMNQNKQFDSQFQLALDQKYACSGMTSVDFQNYNTIEKQDNKLLDQEQEAIEENILKNQISIDQQQMEDEGSQIFEDYFTENYPDKDIEQIIQEIMTNNLGCSQSKLNLSQDNQSSDIWNCTGPQHLIYLIRNDISIRTKLSPCLIAILDQNNFESITFLVHNLDKIDVLKNLLQHLESKLNVYTEQIPQRMQKKSKVMIQHKPFRANLRSQKVQLFYNKNDWTLSWCSVVQSYDELKQIASEYTSKYKFKRAFIQNFFSEKGINDSSMNAQQKDYLNLVSIQREQEVNKIINKIGRQNYNMFSMSHKPLKQSEISNYKYYSNFITFQFEKMYSINYKEFIKQIQEKISDYIEYVLQDKFSKKMEAFFIKKTEFQTKLLNNEFQQKYIHFLDQVDNYNMLPENKNLAKQLKLMNNAANGIFIIDGNNKNFIY
ncbi:hypothetical protein ABPG72_000681 [Tetrahymena utriculariae]